MERHDMEPKEFKSFFKTVTGNEGGKCRYPTRLHRLRLHARLRLLLRTFVAGVPGLVKPAQSVRGRSGEDRPGRRPPCSRLYCTHGRHDGLFPARRGNLPAHVQNDTHAERARHRLFDRNEIAHGGRGTLY